MNNNQTSTQKSEEEVSGRQREVQEASLSWDSDHLKLVEYYQTAEFGKCMELLEDMEVQYPGRPELAKIRRDLG